MNTVDTNKLISTLDHQNLVAQEKEALLQGLIDKIVGHNLDLVSENQLIEKEVIFESSVNGIKYYVVRCCPQLKAQINLSPRELAIAKLVADGLPNKVIANRLQISPWTVASHLRRMFIKLGVTSRTAMISRLLAQHYLPQK